MTTNKLSPGQIFRNTNTLGCIQRIRAYQGRKPVLSIAVSEIEVALAKEYGAKRPRVKLCQALSNKLMELRAAGLV